MNISSTISMLDSIVGDKEAIRILKNAGFDAYDMSFMPMDKIVDHPMNKENYMDYVKEIRDYADSLGIVCNQAHAPFHSSYGDIQRDGIRYEQIVRSIEAAAYLGAKIIVVHPKQHLTYYNNVEKLKEINIEFYKSLIPYCEKYKIKVAVENMWQYKDNKIVDSTCASPEEFCNYIDSVGSEWIVACLDIGHVADVGRSIPDMIKSLGSRLQALHIHDNDLVHDSHMLPFLMNIEFNSVIESLSEIKYKGDITFEADSYFKGFPKELLQPASKLMYEVGRYFADNIDDN